MNRSLRNEFDRLYIKDLVTGYGIIVCRLQRALEKIYNDEPLEAAKKIKEIQLFSSQKFDEEMKKESLEEGWDLMKKCHNE